MVAKKCVANVNRASGFFARRNERLRKYKMKFNQIVMSVVVGLSLSACHITDPSEKDLTTDPCESASCAKNIQHILTASHTAGQPQSVGPGYPVDYLYYYDSTFEGSNQSDYGILDILINEDVLGSTVAKVVSFGVEDLRGSDCPSGATIGAFSGFFQVFDLNTNLVVKSSNVLSGIEFKTVPGHTYRVHFEYRHLYETMGNCQTLDIRFPVFVGDATVTP
jgi:hypothetical protein